MFSFKTDITLVVFPAIYIHKYVYCKQFVRNILFYEKDHSILDLFCNFACGYKIRDSAYFPILYIYIHEYMPVIWLDRENGTNNYWAIFHNEEETYYTKNFK